MQPVVSRSAIHVHFGGIVCGGNINSNRVVSCTGYNDDGVPAELRPLFFALACGSAAHAGNADRIVARAAVNSKGCVSFGGNVDSIVLRCPVYRYGCILRIDSFVQRKIQARKHNVDALNVDVACDVGLALRVRVHGGFVDQFLLGRRIISILRQNIQRETGPVV